MWYLEYIIPPTHINRAGETNPWDIPNNIPPSIPWTLLENKANTTTPICATEDIATNCLLSICLNVDKEAYTIVIAAIVWTKGKKYKLASGKKGINTLKNP